MNVQSGQWHDDSQTESRIKPETEFQHDEVTKRLFEIYADENSDLLRIVQELISPKADELADCFYTNLLTIDESRPFLDHALVSKRLHRSLAEWIQSLFLPGDKRSVLEHLEWQQIVGEVHARAHIPMRLVNHGMRVLKTEISDLVKKSELEDEQKYLSLVLIYDLLDYASSAINESYTRSSLANERNNQTLRMHVMSFSLVVELERLRSSLFDWLRRTVTTVYSKFPEQRPSLGSVYSSDFGLWVMYKAELLFADQPELIGRLKTQLDSIEKNIQLINGLKGDDTKSELADAIEYLNESISNVASLVGDFSSQAIEMESGRDPLTRLFNRRFLPSVMQNMIRVARETSSTFSILACDLNNFKEINDQYGHEIGDRVLVQFGDFLTTQIRTTDFVFRMGGDEFLIILAGADARTSDMIAKEILQHLAIHRFKVGEDISLRLQTAIGVAEYDRHPDFLRMKRNADEALYKAKDLTGGIHVA